MQGDGRTKAGPPIKQRVRGMYLRKFVVVPRRRLEVALSVKDARPARLVLELDLRIKTSA